MNLYYMFWKVNFLLRMRISGSKDESTKWMRINKRNQEQMSGPSRPGLMLHAAKSLGLLNCGRKNGKELVTNFEIARRINGLEQ